MDVFAFLAQHNIQYQRVDHPPVYTVAEAREKVPHLDGAETKNLFVRNKKATHHFLVVVDYAKRVDLKALATVLGVRKLGFASPERLDKYLGITPGSVSLLAILNDVAGEVQVIIDERVWQADRIKCHPLVNTSTLSLAKADVAHLLEISGHQPTILTVPERAP